MIQLRNSPKNKRKHIIRKQIVLSRYYVKEKIVHVIQDAKKYLIVKEMIASALDFSVKKKEANALEKIVDVME